MALDLQAAGGEGDEGGAHNWEREEGAHGHGEGDEAARRESRNRAHGGKDWIFARGAQDQWDETLPLNESVV